MIDAPARFRGAHDEIDCGLETDRGGVHGEIVTPHVRPLDTRDRADELRAVAIGVPDDALCGRSIRDPVDLLHPFHTPALRRMEEYGDHARPALQRVRRSPAHNHRDVALDNLRQQALFDLEQLSLVHGIRRRRKVAAVRTARRERLTEPQKPRRRARFDLRFRCMIAQVLRRLAQHVAIDISETEAFGDRAADVGSAASSLSRERYSLSHGEAVRSN
jgi:hypothetical protein